VAVAPERVDMKRRVPIALRREAANVVKVSHTLTSDVAERLRTFAFYERFSESAVIEYALVRLFASADDSALGTALRRTGAGRRRKAQPQRAASTTRR